MKEFSWSIEILYTYQPRSEVVPRQGFNSIGSLVWNNWARAFKFYTRMNQGLKSCLVKVSSRSIENYRFWSTLKSVDFKLFFHMLSTLCTRVGYEGVELEFWNFIHVWTEVWSRAKVLSRSVENCRFWSTLKIVDFKLFFICLALCAVKFGLKRLS